MSFSANSDVDVLIPVRIDLEMDGRKYKDTVLWNLNEPFLTPEVFAKMVSEENNLSAGFEDDIASYVTGFIVC